MNNNLTIDLQNVSNEDKKILREIIERSNAPKNKARKPVEGETVYTLWENGEITVQKYYQDYMHSSYEQGNIFSSKDRAEFESRRRKFLKRWKDLSIASGEPENKWNGKNQHWYCYCNTYFKTICFEYIGSCKGENTYFATKESLKNAVAEIGEENVKRYILGVRIDE